MAFIDDELGKNVVPSCLVIIVEELSPFGVEAIRHVNPTVKPNFSLLTYEPKYHLHYSIVPEIYDVEVGAEL